MAHRKRDQKTKDLFAYAEDNRPSIVYMATNTVNGKRYIGLTRLSLEKRRATHIMNANRDHGHHNQYFYRALRKHGTSAFVFSILERCSDYKLACATERRLIAERRPEYNLTAGGEGVLGHRFSVATREKMSETRKGRPPVWKVGECPPEVRAKLSASARARKGTYNHSEEVKEKLRANARLANASRRRRVICLTDWREFSAISEATQYYGLTKGVVELYCRGVQHRIKPDKFGRLGLEFAFVEDVLNGLRD
jgi:group I intron endonuclease